ncbi:vacuolar protein sorting-associated protein 37B [Zeugodacus cucurbitae]|uniref:vacuolar protein sorting-associated protein 37B n=1 Tax=Zeugodacus cucurbitae TaxID=28588 RepID=UPI000596A1CD|nr:vacuolar protein sorting-associated protein 37B [Zeugodacus cucurbitae]
MYQEYLNQLQTSIAPLSSDELKDLLNDDEKLDEKVSEVLENLKTQKDDLLIENRSKAESNIEKEPRIIELRGKVNELMDEAKKYCEAVQEKLVEVKEKSGNVSQETALALIQTAAAESEEATDALIKQFTDNEIVVEAFLDEFLVTRKTMHLRKLKAEKMQELIRRQTQPGQRGNIGSHLLPNSGFYPTPGVPAMGGGGVPYPLGPMMPMPRPY